MSSGKEECVEEEEEEEEDTTQFRQKHKDEREGETEYTARKGSSPQHTFLSQQKK